MTFKEYLQTASVRQYAMIGAALPLSIGSIYDIHLIATFLEGKVFTTEQFYQLTKLQLQGLIFANYCLIFGILLIVTALTLTKFSATSKLGSLNVGGDHDGEDLRNVKITTETNVEKTP